MLVLTTQTDYRHCTVEPPHKAARQPGHYRCHSHCAVTPGTVQLYSTVQTAGSTVKLVASPFIAPRVNLFPRCRHRFITVPRQICQAEDSLACHYWQGISPQPARSTNVAYFISWNRKLGKSVLFINKTSSLLWLLLSVLR